MQIQQRHQATQPKEKLKDWTDLWFSEQKKAGYVAIGSMYHPHFYGTNDDRERLKLAVRGKPGKFISLNAFEVDFANRVFNRQAERLKQIRNIGIDLDQYKLKMSIDEALDELQVLILEDKIPEPNLVLTSRGIQLFYTIDGGASPDMAWLSGYITEQFIEKLQPLGADFKAKDVSRIMRVPESINEKNGAVVQPEIWNPEPYNLEELQSYCRPLDQYKSRKQKRGKVVFLKNADRKLLLFYRTNYARLKDLRKLVDLRKGDFTGSRNVFIYIYAYHQSLVLNTLEAVKMAVESDLSGMYSRTDKAMTEKEMDKTIASAYKDCEKFFETYKANGYRIIKKQKDGIKKPYTTANLIKILSITEQEQDALRSVVSPAMKRKHDRERKNAANRAKGMATMQEYNISRKERQTKGIELLAELMEREPGKTKAEYAELLGVSRITISRWTKGIES